MSDHKVSEEYLFELMGRLYVSREATKKDLKEALATLEYIQDQTRQLQIAMQQAQSEQKPSE